MVIKPTMCAGTLPVVERIIMSDWEKKFDKELPCTVLDIKSFIRQLLESKENLWKGYCRTAIFEIVSSVMPVMRVDVDGIPDEIMPGLDELMAMEYLMVWMTQGYNSIISDATPTAHTWCLLHLSVTPEHDATGGMKRYDQTVGTVKTMPIWFDKNMFHATIREILSEIRRSAELIRSSELIQSASGSF